MHSTLQPRGRVGKRTIRGIIVATVGLALTLVQPAAQSDEPPADENASVKAKIAPGLQRKFDRPGGARQDFWLRFGAAPDLSAAEDIQDWTARGEYVVDQLQQHAERQQRRTIRTLQARGVEFESFWITNAIRIENGTEALARELAGRAEVTRLIAPVTYEAPEPVESTSAPTDGSAQAIEWGLANIGADQVWQDGITGSGVVIANIDTGVQYDHPALVDQYRGNNHDGTFTHDYNWFDATGSCDGAPCDHDGHGTHTMGTMVGDDGGANQIGVAPGATWIAANGCCPSDSALVASAEWMLAPTRLDGSEPDVSKRPHIINNSWGTTAPSLDPFFDDLTTAWAASGIFGVWANGNLGPGCSTRGAPGSRTTNYSVGAYDVNDTIADFSSRGSGEDGEIKPNISAPGVNVRSSVPGDGYASYNGTSMATPHVAGTIALLWSAGPDLIGDLSTTRDLLDLTARDTEDLQCGGTAEDNNVYGEGRLDAAALVSNRQVGQIAGHVTDRSGTGIDGAELTITATSDESPIGRTIHTEPDGTYLTALPAGSYTVNVSAYGYLPTQADVDVTVDSTTSQEFTLEDAPMVTVTGQVTDGSGHGWPLYAELTIPGYPNNPVYTDPETGAFSVDLPASDDYPTQVAPLYPGYQAITRNITVGESDTTADLIVPADLDACTAPGYDWNGLTTTFSGWSGATPEQGWQIDGSGSGSWRFDNPQGRLQPPNAAGQFAIADPTASKSRISSTLTSSRIDLTGQPAPTLSVDMRYIGADRQTATIEYSTNGKTWATLWTGGTNHAIGTRTFTLPQAAGQPAVQVRFAFTSRSTVAYWAIDNVFVGTHECIPLPGGLLIGDVRDASTGNAVPWAALRLQSAPDRDAQSREYVADAGRTGALYWLFGNVGQDQLLAQRDGYDQYAADVTLTQDAVTRHDVDLTPSQN